jgi:hypothetical protein
VRDTVRAKCLILFLLPFALNGCDRELTGVQEDPAEDRVLHGVHHDLADGGRLEREVLHYSYGGEPSAWATEKSGDLTSPDTFDPQAQ